MRESCEFVIFAIYPQFLWEGWERYSFRGARPSGGALTISVFLASGILKIKNAMKIIVNQWKSTTINEKQTESTTKF